MVVYFLFNSQWHLVISTFEVDCREDSILSQAVYHLVYFWRRVNIKFCISIDHLNNQCTFVSYVSGQSPSQTLPELVKVILVSIMPSNSKWAISFMIKAWSSLLKSLDLTAISLQFDDKFGKRDDFFLSFFFF